MSSGGGWGEDRLDLAALEPAGRSLDASEPGRGAAHVAQLEAVLADLPGAFDLLTDGVMSVEQSRTLRQQLSVLDEVLQLGLWEQIARRLTADREQGIVRPPARLADLLRKLVIELDPASSVERRKQAEADGKVDYRRRQDGLADINLLGITGPNAQAVLQRIQAASSGRAQRRAVGRQAPARRRRRPAPEAGPPCPSVTAIPAAGTADRGAAARSARPSRAGPTCT